MLTRRPPLPAWLLALVAALALAVAAVAALPRAQAQQATTDVVFVDNFSVDPNGSGVVDIAFDPAGAETMFAQCGGAYPPSGRRRPSRSPPGSRRRSTSGSPSATRRPGS